MKGVQHLLVRCVLLAAHFVAFASHPLVCQSTRFPLTLKAVASGRYLDPYATFDGLPGATTCCDSLGRGTGFGMSTLLGATLMEHKSGIRFDMLLGGGYANVSFTRNDTIGWALVGTGDNARVEAAQSQYRTTIDAYALEFRPEVAFMPAALSGFGLSTGMAVMVNLASSGNQREQLVAPVNAVYTDTKTNERQRVSLASVPGVALWTSLYGGVSWQGDISERFGVQAGMMYELPMTPLIESANGMLSMGRFRVDVGIRLQSARSVPPEPVDDVVVQQEQPQAAWLRGAIGVFELRNDGSLVTVGRVRIEETMSKQLYPLLPYVFFDQEDGVLNANTYVNLTPAQTRRFSETLDFTFDKATSSSRSMITLELYYNLLNILGRRMRDDYPTSTIVLHGYNNGRGNERSDTLLSRRRAESVKDYLVRIWGIEAGRIRTMAGNLSPSAASTATTDERDKEDGFEENRRVEIIPSEPKLLSPVIISDTLREINVPALRYQLSTSGTAPISNWSVVARHPFMPAGDDQELLYRSGSDVPPEYIDWSAGESQRQIPKSADPVVATFMLNGDGELSDSSASTLPIEFVSLARKRRERVGNLTLDRFRLPLFAYGNDELLVSQAEIISNFIKPDLDASAMIRISAFTDRKGTSAGNLALSQKRADQVRGLLQGTSILESIGFGEGNSDTAPPFPNETPEGRLYNRTVEVVVIRRAE